MLIPKSKPGDSNSNRQRRIPKPEREGANDKAGVWHVHCDICDTEYGTVATAFYHRKCPNCQDGASGL
jgi:hypothetical protein